MKVRLLICAAVLALSGCSAMQEFLDQNGGTAELGVTYATLKYIEKAGEEDAQIARAVRVRLVAEDVKEAARGDAVTVEALKAYVMGKLPSDLSPADRFLADALVSALVLELQDRIGEGAPDLDDDDLLALDLVLGWVINATSYYAPAPA